MKRRKIVTLLIAMLMSFMIISCDSSGSEPVTELAKQQEQTEPTPTRAEDIKQTDTKDAEPAINAEESEDKNTDVWDEDRAWTDRDDILPHEENGYIVFGAYEQDADPTNGPDPIEWEILGDDEKGTLLLSRYVLDMQPYNTERIDVTWEDCTLRSWLNDDFINKAFTEREQECINAVTISNPGNEYQKTPGCDPTTDRIFCLSVEDILAHYEFSYYVEQYRYGYSEQLMTEGTRYAKMLGVERLTKYGTLSSYVDGYIEHGFSEECYEINGAWWWLRTLGATGHSPCSVGGDGAAGWGTNVIYNDLEEIGVRPALYIKK